MARSIGSFKVIDNSQQVLNATGKAIDKALTGIGIAAKHNIQEIIEQKHIYDTGDLYRTIDYEVNSQKKYVEVGSPQNYAVFQELGTVNIKNPRPFVKPGILDNIDEYKKIAEDALKNA